MWRMSLKLIWDDIEICKDSAYGFFEEKLMAFVEKHAATDGPPWKMLLSRVGGGGGVDSDTSFFSDFNIFPTIITMG